MKKTRIPAITFSLGLSLLCALSEPADATPILDQSNGIPIDGSTVSLAALFETQQQVTDGIGGSLAGITLYTASASTVTVKIGVGSAFYSGPFAFTGIETIAGLSGTFIDTSAANILLSPGEAFVIDVSGGSGALLSSGTAYSGGDFYQKFQSPTKFSGSMAFQTFINPTSVPEPTTLALFGAGLAGLGAMRRWRKAKA